MSDLYRIKPLEWEDYEDSDGLDSARAPSIFSEIYVIQDEPGVFHWRYCVDEYYDEGSESCESIEDGKAKAQAWYLNRLLPALDAAK